MFTAWGGRTVSEYWGNDFRCGKSGFTVNRGAVNRGFTVERVSRYGSIIEEMKVWNCVICNMHCSHLYQEEMKVGDCVIHYVLSPTRKK